MFGSINRQRNPTWDYSPIYCYGDILHTVQTMSLYPDSKFFVDLPLKVSPEDAQAAFTRLGPLNQLSAEQIRRFINDTFLATPENDMVQHKPADYKPVSEGGLSIHNEIADGKYRDLALAIHEKWESLGRSVIHYKGNRALFGRAMSLVWIDVPGTLHREMLFFISTVLGSLR